jgi:hypothetical protein
MLIHHPSVVKDGLVFYSDPANYKSYPAGQYSYVNNVSLMLDFDGANGSTTFTDKSVNGLTITSVSSPQISTTQSKFGGSSVSFNGSNYLSIANASLFDFSASDWTIEFWFYLDSVPSASYSFCGESNGGGNVPKFGLTMNMGTNFSYSANRVGFWTTYNGISSYWLNAAYTWSSNTWYHISVVQSGSVITLYVNGTSVGTLNFKAATGITGNFRIGADGEGYRYFTGYIDDFCITKSAKYTSSFTPSGPLFLPGRMTDLTVNRSIATFKNGPTYSSSNGGTIVFDGSNDYITAPTSTLFNFGTGDFTIEMWVYPTSVKTFSLLDFRINETNPNGNAFVIGTSASNLWVVYQNGNQITGPTVVANQWVQVIVNRVGTAVKMFLNGVQIGSTWTTSNSFTDGAFVLGTDYPLNARFFQGSVSSIKIYKGKGFTTNEILQNFNATKGRFGY